MNTTRTNRKAFDVPTLSQTTTLDVVDADFARQLERELEEAREEVAYLKEKFTRFNLTTEQSDELYQKWEAIRNENSDLSSALQSAERERDEQQTRISALESELRTVCAQREKERHEKEIAWADCVVKNEALKAAENCDHTYTQEALDLIRKALALDCGNAILERLRKAEEENKARRFQFENKCLQWIEAKKESASLRIKVNDLQESIKGCEHRMMRAESATGGLRAAKLEAESHCKRLSTERDAALSRCRKLEGVLRFIRDECDWKSTDAMGGGDDRIGPACTKALSSPSQAEQKPQEFGIEPTGKMSFPEMLKAAEADPSFREEYERLTGKRYEPSERESVAKEIARG